MRLTHLKILACAGSLGVLATLADVPVEPTKNALAGDEWKLPVEQPALKKAAGLEQIPFYNKVVEHPAYDEFWSEQALDKTLAAQPLKVPTMWIGALWDQEDMWGPSTPIWPPSPRTPPTP